jgi:hypothetical protein
MLARTAPAVLGLLADGVPRSRRAIVASLAESYGKEDVKRTLMRLAVTGRVVERSGRFALPSGSDDPTQG